MYASCSIFTIYSFDGQNIYIFIFNLHVLKRWEQKQKIRNKKREKTTTTKKKQDSKNIRTDKNDQSQYFSYGEETQTFPFIFVPQSPIRVVFFATFRYALHFLLHAGNFLQDRRTEERRI